MTPDLLCRRYQITDPVYKGLIAWRMQMMQTWQTEFFGESIRRVLEIGTGNYPFSLALGDVTKRIAFVGIERDAQQRANAEMELTGRFASVEMHTDLWNEATAKRLGEGGFDLVNSFEVFEHVPAQESFSRTWHTRFDPVGMP